MSYSNTGGAPTHTQPAPNYSTDVRHYNASGQVTAMPAATSAAGVVAATASSSQYDYYGASSRGTHASQTAGYYGGGSYGQSSGGYRTNPDHHTAHTAYDSTRHSHTGYGSGRPSAYSQSGYTDASYGRVGYGTSSHYASSGGGGGGQRMSAYAAAGYGKTSNQSHGHSAYSSHGGGSTSHYGSMHNRMTNGSGHSSSHGGAMGARGGGMATDPNRYTRTDPLAKRPIIGVSETNLYIRGIPTMWREEEVRAYFEQFGPISSVNVWIDKITGESKGTGFVDFQRAQDAAQVITQLDQSYVRLENGESWKYPLQIKFADLRDNRKERSRRDPSVQVTGLAAKRAQFASHRTGNGTAVNLSSHTTAAAAATAGVSSSVYGRSQYATAAPTSTVVDHHGSAVTTGVTSAAAAATPGSSVYPSYDRGRRAAPGGGTHISSIVANDNTAVGMVATQRTRGYSRSRSRERRTNEVTSAVVTDPNDTLAVANGGSAIQPTDASA